MYRWGKDTQMKSVSLPPQGKSKVCSTFPKPHSWDYTGYDVVCKDMWKGLWQIRSWCNIYIGSI